MPTYKHNEKMIFPGKGWTDIDGVKHPKNWHLWGKDTKDRFGVVEIADPEVQPIPQEEVDLKNARHRLSLSDERMPRPLEDLYDMLIEEDPTREERLPQDVKDLRLQRKADRAIVIASMKDV